MLKYDIYRIDMDYAEDKFMNNPRSKNRPGLIIQIDSDRCIIVAMVTSKKHRNQYEIRDWKLAGLSKPSYINFDVVQEFSKSRLGEYVGHLSDFDIHRIKSQKLDEYLYYN